MTSPLRDFKSGVRDILPLLLGSTPFAFIVGLTASNAGFSLAPAFALVGLSYVGASQLVAIELIGQNVDAPIIVATALIVNARYLMYSASIAPHLRSLPFSWKAPLAYMLSDPVYAMSVTKFEGRDEVQRRWYMLGTAIPMWAMWQVGALAGILLGSGLPGWINIDFVIPLVFIALVFSAMDTRSDAVTALIAGVIIVPGSRLPLNLGLMVSAMCGIGAGLLVSSKTNEGST